MKPSVVATHTEGLNQVVDTFLERLEEHIGQDGMAQDLKNFLLKWAMEGKMTIVSSILGVYCHLTFVSLEFGVQLDVSDAYFSKLKCREVQLPRS